MASEERKARRRTYGRHTTIQRQQVLAEVSKLGVRGSARKHRVPVSTVYQWLKRQEGGSGQKNDETLPVIDQAPANRVPGQVAGVNTTSKLVASRAPLKGGLRLPTIGATHQNRTRPVVGQPFLGFLYNLVSFLHRNPPC